jgi:alkane 1-monooxygenase
MSGFSPIKYVSVYSLPVLSWFSFTSEGWITWAPVIFAFGFIPILELFFKPDTRNLEKAEEEIRRDDRIYDWMLYLVVPVQYTMLALFLSTMTGSELSIIEKSGRIFSMGLLCGVMGINVGHELGHRKNKVEQWLAKMLLLSSMYMHFFIEHNWGHHKNVSTDEDPASAKQGESLYFFWGRSILFSYFSAWKLENKRLQRKSKPVFSLQNEMLQFHFIKIGLLAGIYVWIGIPGVVYFLAASIIGILLLETVNYIEHYGLRRKKDSENRYERVMPSHSWNSNHIIGRLMLFELSRHSDHHYNSSRKYQILRHHEKSPQMPTGYPGMMLLSAIPPLWFFIMDKKIKTGYN